MVISNQKTREERNPGDVLATVDLRLTGEGWNGPINEIVHAELRVSGAFQYGNQTCTVFTWENGTHDMYDTRYERVSPDNFSEFALGLMKGRCRDTIEVEIA